MQISKKILALLTSFVLIFSMMAPSLVKASNNNGSGTIKIDVNKDVELLDVQINMSGIYGTEIKTKTTLSNNQLNYEITNYDEIKSAYDEEIIQLLWEITYRSHGDVETYYETIELSPRELNALNTFKMNKQVVTYPLEYQKQLDREKLVLEVSYGMSKIVKMFDLKEDLKQTVVTPQGNGLILEYRYYGINPKANMNKPLKENQYNVYSNGYLNEYYETALNEVLNNEDFEKITFEDRFENIQMEYDNKNALLVSNEIYTNNAHFDIKFKDAQTGYIWSGDSNKDESNNVTLNPKNYGLYSHSINASQAGGNVKVTGEFNIEAENNYHPLQLDNASLKNLPITIDIIKNNEIVKSVQYESKNLQVDTRIDFSDLDNGQYKLDFKVNFEGEDFKYTLYSVHYNNNIKAVKGVVFTFEDENGKRLKDGGLEIFSEDNPWGGQYVLAASNGEFFIEKTKIRKGKKYIAVYENEDGTIIYAQPFIGQESAIYNFTADSLKPFTYNEGEFDVVNAELKFKTGPFSYKTVDVLWQDVLYSANTEVAFNWSGTDAAHKNFYSYEQTLTNEKELTLKNQNWTTLDAKAFYPTAKFDTFGDYKYDTINFAGNPHYVRHNTALTVEDRGINYYFNFELNFDEHFTLPNKFVAEGYALSFGESILTSYSVSSIFEMYVESEELQLTYELKSGNQVTTVTTNNLYEIELDESLAPGSYELTLVKHNLNKEIVDLQMNVKFEVASEESEDNYLQEDEANLPSTIQIDKNTKYGELSNSIQLSMYEVGGHSGFTTNYQYWYDHLEYSYGNTIFKSKKYNVILEGYLAETGEKVFDHKVMTGQEIEDLKEINFTENLVPIRVKQPVLSEEERYAISLSTKEINIASDYDLNNYNSSGVLFGPPEEYLLHAVSMTNNSIKIHPTASIVAKENNVNEISIVESAYKSTKFVDGEDTLSIGKVPLGLTGALYPEYNESRTKLYFPENYKGNLEIGVVKQTEYENSYLYELSITQNQLTSNKVDLALSNFEVQNTSIEYDANGLYIMTEYSLLAKTTPILSITKFEISRWTLGSESSGEMTDDGYFIHYIQGMFDQKRTINASVVIKDDNGEVIFKSDSEAYGLGVVHDYIDEPLKDGIYSVEVEVEVGNDQYVTYTETLNVGNVDEQYVAITSPKDGAQISEEDVSVEGEAYKDSSIQFVVTNNATGEKVANKEIKAKDGKFIEALKGLADGTYTITVTNGKKEAKSTFTVKLPEPEEPVQPEEPGEGTEEPTTPEEPGKGEEEPTTPEEPGKGTEEPTTPEEPGKGTEEPTTPEEPGKGTEEPTTPEEPGKGTEEPTTPEEPGKGEQEPTTPEQQEKVTVDASQVDTQKSTIEVSIPALTEENNKAAITFTKEAMAKITASNKAVELQVGQAEIKVPTEVMKQFGTKSSTFNVELTNKTLPNNTAKAVSGTYSLSIEVDGKVQSTFKEALEITLPFAENVKDKSKAAAFYVNYDKNRYEYMISKVVDGKLVFKTKHFSDYVLIEGNKTFQDITKHWGKSYIEQLASVSIISGKSETSFAPDATITRAEFAALIARTLNLQNEKFDGLFKDVSNPNTWYANDVEAAAKAGIIFGVKEGVFAPNDLISREQMATMIVRAINNVNAKAIPANVAGNDFADAKKISSYALQNVNIASSMGIISGSVENGVRKFKPQNNASRAEASVMLIKMLENL